MGSSEKAGNKGIPSTPRDGAPIELTGLLYSVLIFLQEQHCAGKFRNSGVKLSIGGNLTWTAWAQKIKTNFEAEYFTGEWYKDTLRSTTPRADT